MKWTELVCGHAVPTLGCERCLREQTEALVAIGERAEKAEAEVERLRSAMAEVRRATNQERCQSRVWDIANAALNGLPIPPELPVPQWTGEGYLFRSRPEDDPRR